MKFGLSEQMVGWHSADTCRVVALFDQSFAPTEQILWAWWCYRAIMDHDLKVVI